MWANCVTYLIIYPFVDPPSSKKAKLVDLSKPSTNIKLSESCKAQGTKAKADKPKSNGLVDAKKRDDLKEKKKEEKKYRSIQDNPNASAALKSIFSSSKDAKSKGSAHWVTHNPFYN